MTLAKLVASNVSFAASITNLTTNLANLTMAYTLLANGTTAPAPVSSTHDGHPHVFGVYPVGGYCWTHDCYQVHKNHLSTTCKHKANHLKDCATCANTMHGSTTNKGWEGA